MVWRISIRPRLRNPLYSLYEKGGRSPLEFIRADGHIGDIGSNDSNRRFAEEHRDHIHSFHYSVTVMKRPNLSPHSEFPIETMVRLARCSEGDRIILAGSRSPQRMFELHRGGFVRVATTACCGLPRGQYDVALVEWQLRSLKALAATLDWLVHFLGAEGALVIALDTRECPDHGKVMSMLARLGFRVEAGTRCEHGIAISARRLDVAQQPVAA
jgi:hypothetical protein